MFYNQIKPVIIPSSNQRLFKNFPDQVAYLKKNKNNNKTAIDYKILFSFEILSIFVDKKKYFSNARWVHRVTLIQPLAPNLLPSHFLHNNFFRNFLFRICLSIYQSALTALTVTAMLLPCTATPASAHHSSRHRHFHHLPHRFGCCDARTSASLPHSK